MFPLIKIKFIGLSVFVFFRLRFWFLPRQTTSLRSQLTLLNQLFSIHSLIYLFILPLVALRISDDQPAITMALRITATRLFLQIASGSCIDVAFNFNTGLFRWQSCWLVVATNVGKIDHIIFFSCEVWTGVDVILLASCSTVFKDWVENGYAWWYVSMVYFLVYLKDMMEWAVFL